LLIHRRSPQNLAQTFTAIFPFNLPHQIYHGKIYGAKKPQNFDQVMRPAACIYIRPRHSSVQHCAKRITASRHTRRAMWCQSAWRMRTASSGAAFQVHSYVRTCLVSYIDYHFLLNAPLRHVCRALANINPSTGSKKAKRTKAGVDAVVLRLIRKL